MPREVLETAAYWYVQLNDGHNPEQEYAAWAHWIAADNNHRLAWERMQALERQLTNLPAELALPTLTRASATRRRTVKLLSLFLATGTVGTLVPQVQSGLRLARADYRTATGERQHIRLADNSTLDINTASAVDVNFTHNIRQLRLWRGEVLVQTAPDPSQRPFEVHTDQGVIRALGTCFSVFVEEGHTRVAVLEKAVEIRSHSGQLLQLDAGRQTHFSARDISPSTTFNDSESAWRTGKLIAIERRLDDFLAELARHRPGRIVCAPGVAGLRLSGAFRLGDTDAVLENLAASLPIKLRYYTRYWVMVDSQ